ncbi:hypothetical protein AB0C38_36330 [Amycolatopsis sp. NPDC048633]|uniref:hypothetical protein n=1 Tax=Amycolatopsis sp. NPDC048633 TaxID=3157095 RepID=UPI0034093AF0
MSTPDEWGQVPLAWERVSGAIAVSREHGWEWAVRPAGSATPEELIGHQAAGTHDDVVVIEAAKNPMQATGASFAPGDWGKHGSVPIRGPITGAPDKVLFEVLGWTDEDAR